MVKENLDSESRIFNSPYENSLSKIYKIEREAWNQRKLWTL